MCYNSVWAIAILLGMKEKALLLKLNKKKRNSFKCKTEKERERKKCCDFAAVYISFYDVFNNVIIQSQYSKKKEE